MPERVSGTAFQENAYKKPQSFSRADPTVTRRGNLGRIFHSARQVFRSENGILGRSIALRPQSILGSDELG